MIIIELEFAKIYDKWFYDKYQKGIVYKITEPDSKLQFRYTSKYYLGIKNVLRSGIISIKKITKEEAFELMSIEEKREEIWNFDNDKLKI